MVRGNFTSPAQHGASSRASSKASQEHQETMLTSRNQAKDRHYPFQEIHVAKQQHRPIVKVFPTEDDPKQHTIDEMSAADLLMQRGVQQHDRGEYNQALKNFRRALKAQTKCYGEKHVLVAHTLANIGSVFLRQGRLHEAGVALEKAWEIKEDLRGSSKTKEERAKIGVAEVLNNLGNVAYLRGNYAQSLEFYRQSVKELRTYPEGSHKELANALHNLGRLQVIRKDWRGALNSLSQCQEIEEEIYGIDSIELAATKELAGYAYLALEAYDESLILFSDALSILQVCFGNMHENVATSLVNVAMAMEGAGNTSGACQTYATARDVFRNSGVPKNHSGYSEAVRNYRRLKAQGRKTDMGTNEVSEEAPSLQGSITPGPKGAEMSWMERNVAVDKISSEMEAPISSECAGKTIGIVNETESYERQVNLEESSGQANE